jgi:nucleoside-triphosphatase THEP1
MTIKPVVLLTGEPKIGKSTIIQNIVESFGDILGGFYTREIKQDSIRVGFEIITLRGEKVELARKTTQVVFKNEQSFGDYKVNLDAITWVAIPSLKEAVLRRQIIILDEIGPMEMLSESFQTMVLEILENSDLFVLGTVVQRNYEFSDSIKSHYRVILKTVTVQNRERLYPEILRLLRLTILK